MRQDLYHLELPKTRCESRHWVKGWWPLGARLHLMPEATTGLAPRNNITSSTYARAVASAEKLYVVLDTVICSAPGTSGVPFTAYTAVLVSPTSTPDNKMRVRPSTIRAVTLGVRLYVTPDTTISLAPGINCTSFTASAAASGDRLYAVPVTVIGLAPGVTVLASTKNYEVRVSGILIILRDALLALRAVVCGARL